MAIAKSIRPAGRRARVPASRRSTSLRPRRTPANGAPSASPRLALEQWRRLTLVVPRLRGIYGAAVTAELALRRQDAEQDPEIAVCLRDGVCDPIADQIRALEEVTGRSSDELSGTES
jgi:hypothetical protein